jgi:hypothetical protein
MSSSRIHFHQCFIDVSDAAMEVWLRFQTTASDRLLVR